MTLDQALIHAYENAPHYHAIFGAILGAVGSIGSALIGGRSKKQTEETITDQTSTSSVDFAKLSADAQAAGFNPLTAMRSGAIGGYTTTRTTGKNVTTSSGGGGGGGGIADAIGSIGQLFGSYTQPKNDPIKVRNKTTGAVRSVVGAQVGSTGRAGSVVVAPRLTTVSSPTSRTAPVRVSGRAPLPGLMPSLPVEKGSNRYVRVFDDVTGRETWGVNPDGPEFDQMVAAGVLTAADYARQKASDASNWWEHRKIAANYRTMAKRPVVNNRVPPPSGYRYAD